MRIAICDDGGQGFVLKTRDGIARITFARLEYVEVVDKTVSFHFTDGAVREVTAALSDFEERILARPEFLKVHRSYLVNLEYIAALGGGNIVTDRGHTIPVARQRRAQVQDAYMDFLDAQRKKEKTREKEQEEAECSVGPWRILLVDDESAQRALWTDILSSHGCVVQQAVSGEEALVWAADGSYDCVLLDVMLSGEDGFALCEKLRGLTKAPVIFLSCLTGTDEQMKGFAAGGADYITKDTPAELFWAKVETRIRLAVSGHTRFRYGPLLLELSERKAYMEEKELSLTPVEFDLLWRLSEQAGHIFTPEDLFRIIWGRQPWDGGQRVQTHMMRLRRKLDKAWGTHSFIETVWGQGYRFVPPVC